MRGRLIFPHLVVIARPRYDTSGYDNDFRESTLATGRVDGMAFLSVTVPVQVLPKTVEMLSSMASGNNFDSEVRLVFHFKDLERSGFVDVSTGIAKFEVNDRLVSVTTRRGKLVHTFRNPPGVFARETMPASFGLGYDRNLLIAVFKERDTSVRKAHL